MDKYIHKQICSKLFEVMEKYPPAGFSVRSATYDILDENYLGALMHVTNALSHIVELVNILQDYRDKTLESSLCDDKEKNQNI